LYNFIDNHPVDSLVYSILIFNFVSLFLILIFSISLLYNFFSKSTLELKFIDKKKIMSANYSTKVKYYINKIMSKSSIFTTIHIIFKILVIIFSNLMSIYLFSAYILNLEFNF
jgi:hypothetical protein